MKYLIITGMSGAGKSTAIKFLEDSEVYCVDSIPISIYCAISSQNSVKTRIYSTFFSGVFVWGKLLGKVSVMQ